MTDFRASRGYGTAYSRAILDPWMPWGRPTGKAPADARLSPQINLVKSGSRILRHPYLDPIVYPLLPTHTVNFGHGPLRRSRYAVVKTLSSSALARYVDADEDITITEVWATSPDSELFMAFHRFWVTVLPQGRFLGWQPRDLSPKCFHVHLLDVRLGTDENFTYEEIGAKRPYLTRDTMSVTFKLVAEAAAPASAIAFVGA